MDDGPSIEPVRQAATEFAPSLSALASTCTVPVWVPNPWPAHVGPADLTFARWSEEEVTYCVTSFRRGRPALLVTGSVVVPGARPGMHFRPVPGLPWNAQLGDDSRNRGCWGWMEPPGVQIMLRADGVAAEELIEIMATLELVEG